MKLALEKTRSCRGHGIPSGKRPITYTDVAFHCEVLEGQLRATISGRDRSPPSRMRSTATGPGCSGSSPPPATRCPASTSWSTATCSTARQRIARREGLAAAAGRQRGSARNRTEAVACASTPSAPPSGTRPRHFPRHAAHDMPTAAVRPPAASRHSTSMSSASPALAATPSSFRIRAGRGCRRGRRWRHGILPAP